MVYLMQSIGLGSVLIIGSKVIDRISWMGEMMFSSIYYQRLFFSFFFFKAVSACLNYSHLSTSPENLDVVIMNYNLFKLLMSEGSKAIRLPTKKVPHWFIAQDLCETCALIEQLLVPACHC